MSQTSPMMEQYRHIKNEHRDAVLFFRLGDFYEMFGQDAIEVSALLNLTLTSRNGQAMCGIPYHASHSYISRLLKLGKKIAVCEQINLAGAGRSLAERRVVEVITPGTTVEEDYLDSGESNYLAALALNRGRLAFAYIDISSGEFAVTAFDLAEAAPRLRKELERLGPREIIVQESLLETENAIASVLADRNGLILNRWSDWLFDPNRAAERLSAQFQTSNLKAFGLYPLSTETVAAGTILAYLDDTARSLLPHINTIRLYTDDEYVSIDESTQRNLELVRNMRDGDRRFSLLEVMDETKTPMGLRLLKWRITHPPRDRALIEKRLEAVDLLYRQQKGLSGLREVLSGILDLERLSSRIAMDRAHGKDLAAVRDSLSAYHKILSRSDAIGLTSAFIEIETSVKHREKLLELQLLLESAVADDPSVVLSEGNLIRDGYNTELDRLRGIKDNSRKVLEAYLEEERQATGIQSLKIKYNRLIGYFFEVTKTHLAVVPKHFIRRQAVVGGERYTTERLSALESEINAAADRIIDLERNLFIALREQTKAFLSELLGAAKFIAALDVAQSSARAATLRVWTKPTITEGTVISITEGRHPVVEAHLPTGAFIPNDTALDAASVSFVLLTGPNMAGKSTYLRQSALISLMAQIGSFVPASHAEIGLVDKIFCRVGAQDNLARGESTFLVEMSETAHILRTASPKSLVIMDEVGRGTGTHDGLSIAWAVCEELLRLGCRTLFATHYHELSELVNPRLVNRSMDVIEEDGDIVFLRRIREGATAESFGIHVARLAGLPEAALDRAGELLSVIRSSSQSLPGFVVKKSTNAESVTENSAACSQSVPEYIIDLINELTDIDPNCITPLEALSIMTKWHSSLRNNKKAIEYSENLRRQKSTRKIDIGKKRNVQKKQDDEPSLFS